MYCDSCKLDCKYKSPVFPSGTITPDIYILGDYSDSSDIEHKIVYNPYAQKGMYLHNVLSSLGLDTKCRIFNNIRCDISNQYQDYKDIYKYCSEYAKIDIYKTNPKVIITLGADSAKLLLGKQFDTLNNTHGKLMTAEIRGKKFKVVPTYSLSYILKEFTDSEKFINDFRFAKSFIEGKLVDISSKKLEVARNYEEFIEYYNKNLKDRDFISYDIETNAMDPRSEDAEIVGFSLAPSGMTGIYISRRTLDYSMPEDDWSKITKFVVENIISKHKILVHNCMYEIPFTLNKWNYYITNFEDSLIKARLVLGGTIGAGLKEQCIKQLNYPDWDKDLGNYLSSMKALINGLKPTSSGKLRDEYSVLKDNSLVELSSYEFTSSNKRTDSISSSSKLILRVLNKYYSGDELSDIIDKVSKEIIRLVDIDFTGMLSYGVVPSKIIARYGAMDAVATQDLNKFLDQRIDELSDELKINLHNGYKYLKQHFVAGTWMELNGMNWNDEVATQEYNWYNNKCIECAMNMINSHFLDEYLFQNTQSEYNQYLVDNKLDELIDVFGNFKVTKSGIKPEGGKLIRFKNILSELGQDYINSHRDDIISLARLNASKIHDNYKNLKKYFNPASPTKKNKEFLSNIFVTDETKVARIIQKLQVLIDDPSVDKSVYSHEHELLRVLTDYTFYNKFVDEYNSSENKDEYLRDNLSKLKYNMYYVDNTSEYKKLSNKDRFDKFVEVLSKSHIVSKDIEKIVIDSYRYKMESVSELDLIEINELYVTSGVDVDNPDTWPDSYRFLVNFRLWKKCNKIITSYIEGDRVGRGSVYIVDKSSYKNGDTLTRRKRLYDGPPKSNEMCVMQSKFGVCTAESYRWRSGLHTIPMGVSVRHIYTSRYDGGVIAAPDFCLAGDTKIRLANGTSPKIKDLVGVDEFYVYSYDEKSRRIKIGRGHDARLVRYANDMYRITLENGDTIDCTSNHKFFDMRSERMKEAKDFIVGDSILPIRFSKYNAHGVYNKGRECILDPWDSHQELTHYLADEYNLKVGKYTESSGTDRHHIDMNKFNNDPRNIIRVTRSEHTSIHSKDRSSDPSYIEELRSRARSQWTNQSYRDKMHQVSLTKGKESLLKSNSDPHSIRLRKIAKRMKSMNKLHNALVDMQVRGIVPSPHTWNDCLSQIDHPRGCKSRAITHIYGDFAKFIYVESETYDYPKEYIDAITAKIYFENRTNNRTLSTIKRCYDNARKLGLSLSDSLEWDRAIDHLRKSNIIGKFDGISSAKLLQIFKSFDNVHKYCMNNHKIAKIEKLSDTNVPVYCFTVDEYHNFFLDCGVLSSNSQMELRTMAGAANCEPMMEAFRNGADIHRENAAKIFRKPPEEISHEERRYSKMASFMILYGGDYKNFSKEFLGGDENLGKYIYDSFYSAYPQIEDYIKSKHEEARTKGKVTTLMDMFMYCTPSMYQGDVNRQMRVAQNSVIQSFSGDTKILGLDGKSHMIKDLADTNSELEVYSYDTTLNKIVPTKGINPQCTGYTDTWYKLTLDNGKSVKVTPEHKMMLRDGTYREAKDLVVGQSLMPLYVVKHEGSFTNGYLKTADTNEFIHHMVYYNHYHHSSDEVLSIHHINFDKYDNRLYNLVGLTNAEHIRYHRLVSEYAYSLDEHKREELENWLMPIILKRYEFNVEDISGIVTSIKEFHNRIVSDRDLRLMLTKKSMSYRNQHKNESWSNNQRAAVSASDKSRIATYGNITCKSKEEYSKMIKDNWVKYRSTYVEALKIAHASDLARMNHSVASVARESSPDYVFNRVKKQLLDRYEKGIDWSNPNVWDATAVYYPGPTRRYSWYITKHMTWDEFVARGIELVKYHNHKIAKIEVIHLDTPEPKYDLHVPKYENFALECGVFTHNSASSMIAGCCLYKIMEYIWSHKMKTKIILFVHDSVEVDIPPEELIEIGSQIIPIMSKFPNEQFHMPVKADLVLGGSLGKEVEVHSIEHNDDYSEGILDLEGYQDEVDELIELWKPHFRVVEATQIGEVESEYKSWSQLWIPKLAIQKGYGTYRYKVHMKVRLVK